MKKLSFIVLSAVFILSANHICGMETQRHDNYNKLHGMGLSNKLHEMFLGGFLRKKYRGCYKSLKNFFAKTKESLEIYDAMYNGLRDDDMSDELQQKVFELNEAMKAAAKKFYTLPFYLCYKSYSWVSPRKLSVKK